MKKSVFSAIQWTWGLPQTLLGSALYLVNRKHAHFDYKGACVTLWDRSDGVSLGKFIFVPSEDLTEHEFGHSVQSLILGPMYLILIGLPSIIWARHPHFKQKRKKTGKSYYSPIFESTANKLGSRKN